MPSGHRAKGGSCIGEGSPALVNAIYFGLGDQRHQPASCAQVHAKVASPSRCMSSIVELRLPPAAKTGITYSVIAKQDLRGGGWEISSEKRRRYSRPRGYETALDYNNGGET